MNVQTIQRARKISINRRPDEVIDAEAELSMTPLGIKLLELLEMAASHDLVRCRREAGAHLNMRQREFEATPVERLAAKLLNDLGPPEECWTIRDVAESFASDRMAAE